MKLITTIFLISLFFQGAAQEKKCLVTGQFDNIPLKDFFQQLESQCNYIFYYDERTIASLSVSSTFMQEPLQSALRKAMENSGLQFAIYNNDRVFITKGIKLITTLPAGFYSRQEQVSPSSIKDTLTDYGLQLSKPVKSTSVNQLHEVGTKTSVLRGTATVIGNIRNARTGEPLVNASVFVNTKYATITDAYGYYTLTVPAGSYTLNIMAIGMRDTHFQLMVYGNGRMDADIPEQITMLKEVVVLAQKKANVMQVQMGIERLNIEMIRRVPSLFGETDVLRVITTLPGVKTVGEASTGFNVRGGSTDQNLVLFNESNIYNPSHFFGLFSAFNPELIKDVELYKSSIPARFGGRLSSVLEINSREGNKKKLTGSAGIGLITSRINLEGPISKDRTSFIFGGRSTYANWLLKLLPDEYENSRASFQDLNLGISHRFDSSNYIYFNGYFSQDRFALNSDTTYGYSNRNLNIKWKKNFNNRLVAEFITGIDEYRYKVFSDSNVVNAFTLRFSVRQLYARVNFIYYKNQRHSFDFGVSSMLYKLKPGSLTPLGDKSVVVPDVVGGEQALESGIYITHRFNPSNKLSISTGLRYSLYNYLGPREVNYYAGGLPLTPSSRLETKNHGSGEFIKTYGAPEIRFSARYAFSTSFSVKAGYNLQRQYIHMLSNTTAIAPTDIWKLSDPNIKPQQGDQVSLGFYSNLKRNTIETSVEVYYKRIRDYLDYKPGAKLVMNHEIETEVINTEGKAYGVELLIKKPGGKLNGWISYAWSRILLRSDDPTLTNLVNNGEWYPANYDKPHDVTLMGTFRVNHRFSVSLNSTYSTGRPITLPIARYYYAGAVRVLYSDRNAHRIPANIRTDFSMNIEGNHKEHQKTHNSWTIGIYNVLGRKNPYSVYYVSENGVVNGYKLSIFGSIIPFVNFNIRF